MRFKKAAPAGPAPAHVGAANSGASKSTLPMDTRTVGENLVRALLVFCRLLQQHGLMVGPDQKAAAVRSLGLLGLVSREQLRLTLAINFGIRPEDLALFNRIFDAFWTSAPQAEAALPAPPAPAGPTGFPAGAEEVAPFPVEGLAPAGDTRADAASASTRKVYRTGYSPKERLAHVDLLSLAAAGDEAELRRLVNLAVRLPVVPRYLTRRAKKRGALDVRRMLRRSLELGGEVLVPVWRKKVRQRCRLVLLCDISGSMEAYSRVFLAFLWALQKERREVETFVFGTRLSRATDALQLRDFASALARLSHVVQDWGGGTDIGKCLAEFNAGPGRWLVHKRTGVAIVSDGWDRGDQERLRREMGRLASRAAWVFWLNPLLGCPGYEPLSLGLLTVQPFVRAMLPASNLADLFISLKRIYASLA